jgi:hypothetical protein
MKLKIRSLNRMKSQNKLVAALGVAALTLATLPASATLYRVTGGSAAFTITEGTAASIFEFDAYFDATKTRAQTLSDPAPGNAPFVETSTSVTLSDPIRPYGVAASITGRTPQMTTLEFDDSDVMGSWSLSDDGFGFTGSSTLGEQIALTSMQRWTGPFPGSLIYGDFALRRTSATELKLTSNIDFLNAEYASIVNPTISILGNTLTISGDLRIDQGLQLLDPGAVAGTDFGDFTLTATIQAVPEPSALALLGIGALFPLLRRKSTVAK